MFHHHKNETFHQPTLEEQMKMVEMKYKQPKYFNIYRTTPQNAMLYAQQKSREYKDVLPQYPSPLPEKVIPIPHKNPLPATLRSTIIYMILGQAVGDAVGLATERLDKEQAFAYYKGEHIRYDHFFVDGHRSQWMNPDYRCADWTDDTDQCLLILDSITRHNGECNPDDFAQRMYQWLHFGFSELGDLCALGFGRNFHKVTTTPNWVRNPIEISKMVWEQGGKKTSSNGSVMRTSVASIPYFWDEQRVVENARKYGQITHYDNRCQASVTMIVLVLAKLLQGRMDVEQIIEEAMDVAEKDIVDLAQKEDFINYVYATTLDELKLCESRGFCFKTIACGILSLRLAEKMMKEGIKSKKEIFIELMENVVYEAGDADTNGCVVGAVLGAYLKDNCLPDEWLQFDNKNWLYSRINNILRLYELDPIQIN